MCIRDSGTREELLAQCGLDSAGIQRAIYKRLRSKDMDGASEARSDAGARESGVRSI